MTTRTVSRAPLFADSLLADEIELERSAVADGMIRYRRMAQHTIANENAVALPIIEEIAFEWLPAMRVAVRNDQRLIKRGLSDIGSSIYGAPLVSLVPMRMAYVTIREVMGLMLKDGGEAKVSRVAYAIGRGVCAEINFDLLRRADRGRNRESDPIGHVKRLDSHFHAISTRSVNRAARKSLDDPVWDRTVCSHIGIRLLWTLIGCASSAPPDDDFALAFHVQSRMRSRRLSSWLVLDPKIMQRIDAGLAHRGTMRPKYLPMVIQPFRWSDKAEGGYVQIRTPFIAKPSRSQKAAMDEADLEPVYDRLHALSATAWRPNEWILDVARELRRSGGGACGLPHDDDIPMPPVPDDIREREAKERMQFWREYFAIKESNKYLRAERFRYETRFTIADTMRRFERFYLPMHLDFRGRCYAVPSTWSHQKDDFCRGTIEFADQVEVTEEGRQWLRIFATSVFGFDRQSLESRERWAIEHDEMIRAVVRDPISSIDFWSRAKKPWQFLSACRALVDETSAMHAPVEFDCTCNGLQHYAALGRDERGGAAVNLLDSAEPSDIYQRVADLMLDMIEDADWSSIRQFAGLIDRDLAKGPTMTMVYGVTRFGVWRQIRQEANMRNIDLSGSEVATFARLIQTALDRTVNSATRIMQWIRRAVVMILDNDPHALIRWTSPTGFPVVQPYRSGGRNRIRTIMGSITVGQQESAKAARGKHTAAVAANFVHSLDAAHLGDVALWAYQQAEPVPYGANHDAHRTHASNVPRTQQAVRDAFADLHSEPRLEMLRDEWQARYGIAIPPLPATGSLDINATRTATYFAH